jgi:hypothetical protein
MLDPDSMDRITRKFTLQETRSKLGAIVDVIGRTGHWPFRRTISYHVGINCDAIAIRDVHLHVQRCGRTIATAVLPGAPKPLRRFLLSGWESLLHPRHASADRPTGIKWEDLLQPRRPK